VEQPAFVKATRGRSVLNSPMLCFRERDPDNVGTLKRWFGYLLEVFLEVSDIVVLPKGR
jgi:hypothetical protein